MNGLSYFGLIATCSAVTALAVYVVLKIFDLNRWRHFRQNMVLNLFDRTLDLARLFEKALPHLMPSAEQMHIAGLGSSMAQHNLDSGTALRAFEARAREKSNAIRASLELGLISADPRLAATITAFQICLDDVISSLSLAIRTGNDAGYQEIDTATKSYWVAMNQRLYSETPIWDQVTGERRIVRRPFNKLSMYVNNLAVSVGAANVVFAEDKTEHAKPYYRIPGLKRPGFCVRYISANAGASDHDEADRNIAIQKYDQFGSLLQSIDSVLEEILWPERNAVRSAPQLVRGSSDRGNRREISA